MKFILFFFTLIVTVKVDSQPFPYAPSINNYAGVFSSGTYNWMANNATVNGLNLSSNVIYNLKATQSIHLSPITFAGNFNTGSFHAEIDPSILDIASFHPTAWNIHRFDRFEIGIKLPASIDQQVEDFLNGLTGVNPYDMDQIILEGDFHSLTTNQTYTREGFYYRDIAIVANNRVPSKSLYPFRIRFAPTDNGSWTFNLRLKINSPNGLVQIASFNNGQFEVTDNGKRGFLSVGNNHHLKDVGGNDFFVIGQDFAPVPGNIDPEHPELGAYWDPSPDKYDLYRSYIEDMYDNGGNFIRIPAAYKAGFLIEWEELGVFGSNRKPDENYRRQWIAYELDKVFEKMEQRGIYGQLLLESDQITNGTYGSPPWSECPYSQFGNHWWLDFYVNQPAIAQFKKRLRYIHARYGYSSNLAIYETNNETNFLGKDLPNSYKASEYTRSVVKDWAMDIGNYLKTGISYPAHLTTIGFANDTYQFPGDNYNPTTTPAVYDIRSPHSYGHDKNVVKTRYQLTQKHIYGDYQSENIAFPGGVLFGELGVTDGFKTDDCFDEEFHNGMWTSAMSGAIGAGLYRYGYERNDLRYLHMRAIKSFFSDYPYWNFPFQTESFSSKYAQTPGYPLIPNYEHIPGDPFIPNIECIYNVNADGSRGFGWVHNYYYYWAADVHYFNVRNSCESNVQNPPPGHPENFQNPQPAGEHTEEITLNGFSNVNNSMSGDDFDLEIWNCYGPGGIMEITNESVNIFGNINHVFTVQGSPTGPNPGYPDFAFKIYPAPEDHLRTMHNDKKENINVGIVYLKNDTSLWSNTPIIVEPSTNALIKYHYWDFGNGLTSHDIKTTITYSTPGAYKVKYTTLNSNNDTVTYVQTIVLKEPTRSGIKEKVDGIDIYPNPSNSLFNIQYNDDLKITLVNVIDNMGKIIKTINSKPQSIDLNNYSNGLYQLQFQTEKTIISKKIILTH